MPTLINKTQIIEDRWTLVTAEQLQAASPTSVPADYWLIPWSDWSALSQKATDAAIQSVGVILPNTIDPEDVLQTGHTFTLIAIEFPVFTDGRGYSLARMLRERGCQAELRAVGDVLTDQLFFMARCGFDSFALKEGKDPQDALKKFETFSVTYQAAADSVEPIYQR